MKKKDQILLEQAYEAVLYENQEFKQGDKVVFVKPSDETRSRYPGADRVGWNGVIAGIDYSPIMKETTYHVTMSDGRKVTYVPAKDLKLADANTPRSPEVKAPENIKVELIKGVPGGHYLVNVNGEEADVYFTSANKTPETLKFYSGLPGVAQGPMVNLNATKKAIFDVITKATQQAPIAQQQIRR